MPIVDVYIPLALMQSLVHNMLREGHGTGVVIRYSALSTDLQPVGDFNSENDVSTEFCRSSSGIFTRTAQ